MFANAKQFVPPTNKAFGPQINAKNTGMVREEEKKKEMGKIRVLREILRGMFVARGKADSWSRPGGALSRPES